MSTVTDHLHRDHEEIAPDIELLRTTADAVGWTNAGTVRRQLDTVIGFLQGHLLPHAAEEEEAFGLYTRVDEALGVPYATAGMRFDHERIRQMVGELVALRRILEGRAHVEEHHASDLRRLLYGLYTLATVHIAKEETLLMPLLEPKE
jgi:hemerythrin-like domain-containing protein